MDEDKSSSNLLPVENTGSVGAPPDPAGGSRQALFTPQPEPVEPAGSMVAPEQPSTDLSHPYFSNHPAQTFNTEAGDIILNTGSPQTKQNKRLFIIGGIVLVVVVAAIVGVGVWRALHGVENGGTENIEETFNRFANYYLFNENSNKPLEGEWNRNRFYAVEEAVSNDSKNFFQQAKTYFDKYKSLYDGLITQQEDETNSADTSFVEAYTDAFNFLYLYSQTEFFDTPILLQLYVSSGAAAAYEAINSRYSTLANTDYQLQKDFAEDRILYDSAQIDRLEIYSQSGCLKDDGSFVDDDGCTVNLSNFDTGRIEMSYDIPDLPSIPQDIAHETARMLYTMANQGLYK